MSYMERNLITQIDKRALICLDGNTYFIYCTSGASWFHLYSRTGSNELLKYTGINDPVNYIGPLDWAYGICKRMARRPRVGEIEPSVCFGVTRMSYKVVYKPSKCIVYYKVHRPVIQDEDPNRSSKSQSTFVVSPIVMPWTAFRPVEVTVDFSDELLNRILAPLRDDQKHDFLWRVGRALVDSSENSNKCGTVMVMYGRYGGEGKSVLLKMLSALIPDASVWCGTDLFGKSSKWPPSSELITLFAQKRFLICDDCEIRDGFSYSNIKRWTSGTPVTLEDGSTCHLSQSAFVSTNNIPLNDKDGINSSIGRRLVIYHMDKNMSDYEPPDVSEIDNVVILRFISMAVSVYTADMEVPPTSLPIALYSFFRRNINKITAGLIHDPSSDESQCLAATSIMAMRCGVEMKTLAFAFKAMSPRLVRTTDAGNGYIVSLRPMKMEYTKHGLEVVANMEEKQRMVPNLNELLKGIYGVRQRSQDGLELRKPRIQAEPEYVESLNIKWKISSNVERTTRLFST
ncbi:hypothetical protein E4U17_006318 [Claviceps sp. LM77 group G4]|nr:hypothetical protein E4U17_006318 [Claviceps sp. LM77 group G4]KAG6081256.1 hypothetical protein E4U33_006918 [Claviceps sp. LM78 group G4]